MKDRLQMLVLFAVILGVFSRLPAQDTLSFRAIDSLTYRAYEQKDWKGLISLTDVVLGSGIDYYYLRMRLGIACYELKKYEQAIPQFRKALEFNRNDQTAEEYLYFALLFSGRYGEAELFTQDMQESLKRKLNLKPNRFKAFAEGGIMINPEADSLLAYSPAAARVHNYLVTRYTYGSAGISGTISPLLGFTLGFQSIGFSITDQYQLPQLEPFRYDVSFNETSLYGAIQANLKHGFTARAAVRTLTGQLGWYTYQATPGGANFLQNTAEYRDRAIHLGISKRFPYFNAGLSADINRFKGVGHFQAGASATLYPLGNLNFYLTGEVSRTAADSAWVSQGTIIGKYLIGTRILPKLWLEASYTSGDIRNWSENQAFIVYNNYDPIRKRIGISLLTTNLTQHLDFSIRYQWTQRVASWALTDVTGNDHIENQFYPYHGFIVGASWRF